MSKLVHYFILAIVVVLCAGGAFAQTTCASANGANAQSFNFTLDVSCTSAGKYKCNWTTTGTQVRYATFCISAHPLCYQSGSYCPVYINTENWNLAARVKGTPMIWVDVANPISGWNDQCIGECNKIKHFFAAFPRWLATQFPGMDKKRVWALGFGAGAGGVQRGLCDSSKGYDRSPFGDTSDIYAGVAFMGGCGGCSKTYGQNGELIGALHYFSGNGGRDTLVGPSGCINSLQQFAVLNGCNKSTNAYCNIQPGDPYFPGYQADGTNNGQRVGFGPCGGGDVIGYFFKDMDHLTSTQKSGYYNPRVSMNDIFWAWQAGRSKSLAQIGTVTENSCSNSNPSATPNPGSWSYTRSDTYPNGFNPSSYWKATGDPFLFPSSLFTPIATPTSSSPVVPPLVAQVQVIGWDGFPPISTVRQNTLMQALANATGKPVSSFTIADQAAFGPRISIVVTILDANSYVILQEIIDNADVVKSFTGAVSVSPVGGYSGVPSSTSATTNSSTS